MNSSGKMDKLDSVTEIVWFVGKAEDLPSLAVVTNNQVLKGYFFLRNIKKLPIQKCLSSLVDRIHGESERIGFLTLKKCTIRAKVQRLLVEYDRIRKNRGVESEWQLDREHKFSETLKETFKCFFESPLQTCTSKTNPEQATATVQLESNNSIRYPKRKCSDLSFDDGTVDDDSDIDYESTLSQKQRKRWKIAHQPLNVGVPNLQKALDSENTTSDLDRTFTSSRKAVKILGTVVQNIGENLNNVALSHSTIHRRRIENRDKLCAKIFNDFKQQCGEKTLAIHWDGKKMADTTNCFTKELKAVDCERMAVLVSGVGTEKILGIPKLSEGSGKMQAESMFKLITEWKVSQNLVAMCFDTTASNTGIRNGACRQLEEILGHNLLYLACRHHIQELIAGAAFEAYFGKTTAPQPALLVKFQNAWTAIDQTAHRPLVDKRLASDFGKQLVADSFNFLNGIINSGYSFLRDDYKECAELAFLVLGGKLPDYNFKACGASHHARWMSKIIYSFKMYLFRSEFKLENRDQRGLKELCLFFALVYVKSWCLAPDTVDAPHNDMQLIKQLENYRLINKTLSQKALEKIKNHLWYLSPELVPLSLFSSKVSNDDKRKMQSKILSFGCGSWRNRTIKLKEVPSSSNLYDLVDSSSICALRLLKVDIALILHTDPDQWKDNPEYEKQKQSVMALRVTNDCAERSIALVSKLNSNPLTRDETEFQKIIQVIEHDRKLAPGFSKEELVLH